MKLGATLLFSKTLLASFLAILVGDSSLLASVPLIGTPQADGENVPVRAETSFSVDVPVQVETSFGLDGPVAMIGPGGVAVPGQMVADADGKVSIYWIIPKAEAGKAQQWRGNISFKAPGWDKVFSFRDGAPNPGDANRPDFVDLLFAGRAVTRTQIAHEPEPQGGSKYKIWKIYNKVYDRAGRDFITTGTGGLYPHHRGIYLGWSRTGFDGGRHDTWHMTGPSQQLKKITDRVAGPVLGRYTVHIDWKTKAGKVILEEARTITVYRQPEPALMLMDLSTSLKAVNGDVELAGDPEHAGCQYRPHNEVARNKSARYLFPLEEINEGNVNKTRDMPWAALSYKLGENTYEVQHLSHPDIPKGNVYSAYRDYGRFGAYFKTTVAKGETLSLQYRIRVAEGELGEREAYARRYTAFAKPVKAVLDAPK
jgi:hypothetical protein